MRRVILLAIVLSLVSGIAGNVAAHALAGPTRVSPELQKAIDTHNDAAVQHSLYTGPELVRYEVPATLLPPLIVATAFVLVIRRGRRRWPT